MGRFISRRSNFCWERPKFVIFATPTILFSSTQTSTFPGRRCQCTTFFMRLDQSLTQLILNQESVRVSCTHRYAAASSRVYVIPSIISPTVGTFATFSMSQSFSMIRNLGRKFYKHGVRIGCEERFCQKFTFALAHAPIIHLSRFHSNRDFVLSSIPFPTRSLSCIIHTTYCNRFKRSNTVSGKLILNFSFINVPRIP